MQKSFLTVGYFSRGGAARIAYKIVAPQHPLVTQGGRAGLSPSVTLMNAFMLHAGIRVCLAGSAKEQRPCMIFSALRAKTADTCI